jgi:hypothetical protein
VADTVLIALAGGARRALEPPIDAAARHHRFARLRRQPIDEASHRQTVAVLGRSAIVESTVLVARDTTLAMLPEDFQVGGSATPSRSPAAGSSPRPGMPAAGVDRRVVPCG